MTEILEYVPAAGCGNTTIVRLLLGRRALFGAALALLPVALWCLTHRYRGLVGDAELYALQALSRTNASLGRDVFLSSASQDHYTVFSPFYAFFIRILGLRGAALSLLVLFKVCFYSAAWTVARKLSGSWMAALTTALLVVAPCEYGAYHVFSVSEDMLTARTVAEALSMTALCLHIYDRKGAAFAVAALGLCIHAIMALPMVLLLLSLHAGIRASAWWALAFVAAVLCAASIAVWMPHWTPAYLSVMDPSWLSMVQERSQFVFLQLWRPEDWAMNSRPILSLLLCLLVLRDARVRAIGVAALIVGAAGLAVAFVAGSIGPVTILLQGQAWRWIWVPETISLLVLAPAVFQMWREDHCGPLCAVVLLAGWICPANEGVYYVSAALSLWIGRNHVPVSAGRYLRFIAVAIGTLVVARVAMRGWKLPLPFAGRGRESEVLLRARSLLGSNGLSFFIAFLVGYAILRSRSLALQGALALALGAITALAAPGAFENPRAEGTAAQIGEFSDWRNAIPAGENVFVTSQYYSAAFMWFTLQRPSYLTVDQSSGVIFSQAAAVEIRRRSEVLLPMEQPDWRLMSNRAAAGGKFEAHASPLTTGRLLQICRDPALNFVVAKEDVGFEPLRHRSTGGWNDWNLYDCKRVNSRKNPK